VERRVSARRGWAGETSGLCEHSDTSDFSYILLGWPAMASRIAQIRKSVLTLALPVTVSSLLQRTEGIAAVFLVGGLGATSIAAVGLGQLLAFMATTLVS
jgi:Na+-driven multidrug efflux pump